MNEQKRGMPAIKSLYCIWTYVADADHSISFYRDIMGFDIRFRESGWVEFTTGNTAFAVLQRPPEKGPVRPSKLRIMLEVNDIAAWQQYLLSCNVTLVGDIRQESYGALLTVQDPDGHWFELYQSVC